MSFLARANVPLAVTISAITTLLSPLVTPLLMEKILSMVSMVGIALIVAVITASGCDSLMSVGVLLVCTSILHNLTGYTVGYLLA